MNNRVGEDGVGLNYSGDSAVISPKGDVLVACEPFADEVKQVDIDLKALFAHSVHPNNVTLILDCPGH